MDIGYSALLTAFIISVITIPLLILAARSKTKNLKPALAGVYLQVFFITLSIFILLYYLLTRNFQVEYVANNTELSLPLLYTVSALWSGAEGSLLFWAWVLALFALAFVLLEKKDKVTLYASSILLSVQSFFLLIILFFNNPFQMLGFTPADGIGLNPLLINPGMLFHPPTLFIGYAGLTIPFALAIGGLIARNEMWIFRLRRWSLFSWLFLGAGILLGGAWSYVVLGWGGYWAWDPIENASLIPWLIATALLHSVMLQESKKGMKLWNVLLSIMVFETIILATFLTRSGVTRSGVISSVHAFGESASAPYFSAYLFSILIFSLGVIFLRRDQLKSKGIFEAPLSRETTFLLNNLLFVVIAATILWGTIFPIMNEAITGSKLSVGPQFYNTLAGPVLFSLVLLMAFCVTLAWRRTGLKTFLNRLRYPLIVVIPTLILTYLLGFSDPLTLFGFSASAFALVLHLQDYIFDLLQRRKERGHESKNIIKTVFQTFFSRRRRYGGYVVHIGMLIIFLGLLGTNLYQTTFPVTLNQGESQQAGEYLFRFDGSNIDEKSDQTILTVQLGVIDSSGGVTNVSPSLIYYSKQQTTIVNVGIISLPLEDIYIIPQEVFEEQLSLRISFMPLVSFIWYGGLLSILGVVLSLLPMGKKKDRIKKKGVS
jgi:cytochrome c-type biogenesis protein CcmF